MRSEEQGSEEEQGLQRVEDIRNQLPCGARPTSSEQGSTSDRAPELIIVAEGPLPSKWGGFTGFVPKRGAR